MTPRPRHSQRTFFELIPQLFLFPLLIVTVAVLVWLLFVASAQDNRSVTQLVADIRSGGDHARQQDAYALAQKAIEIAQDGEYFSEEDTRLLLGLVRSEKDPDLARFFTMAVGSAGRPDLTVPVLREILDDAASLPAARMHAIRGLGLSRSPQAVAPLLKVAGSAREPAEWEFRWNALAGLANLRSPEAVPLLEDALEDDRRELRWSAACWLANAFGDASGVEILRQLVDWEYLDAQIGEHGQELLYEQKEQYMLMALEGLARVGGVGDRELIEARADDERSFKVRNAALKLRDEIGGSSRLSQGGSGTALARSLPGASPSPARTAR